jgi:hypothetical protein
VAHYNLGLIGLRVDNSHAVYEGARLWCCTDVGGQCVGIGASPNTSSFPKGDYLHYALGTSLVSDSCCKHAPLVAERGDLYGTQEVVVTESI